MPDIAFGNMVLLVSIILGIVSGFLYNYFVANKQLNAFQKFERDLAKCKKQQKYDLNKC